jgi:hypothetical protein
MRAVLVLACGCARGESDRPADRLAWLVLESPGSGSIDVDAIHVAPREAVESVARSGGRVVVAIDPRAVRGEVLVHVPGGCPLALPLEALRAGATVARTLAPLFDVRAPDHAGDLGYGAAFALDVDVRCPQGAAGSFTWTQVSGPPLADVRAAGPHFEARMPPGRQAGLQPPDWGLVPVSPRTSSEVWMEVERRPAPGSGEPAVRRRVRLAAADRARGLPTVPLDTGVLLAGSGWSVASAPPGASATVAHGEGLAHLRPDASGEWLLRDAGGRTLTLRAARYDETPLDCGRAGCHGAIAAAVERSPMTAALRVRVESGPRADLGCAIACHATGEPGARDGGFADVARGLSGGALAWAGWSEVPRALRRVGGVTCLGCHGPGAIPQPEERWALLRADVCATCHDAPPEYGHVAAWRASRMARADADPRVRADAACARCHTTAGFLAQTAERPGAWAAPEEAGPVGVTCAACHAVHDPADAARPAHALLRRVELPASLEGASIPEASLVCIPCHAPGGALAPEASAAALWAGVGGVDVDTAEPLPKIAPHGAVERGCLGCHGAGPANLRRGAAHAFASDPRACAPCHAGGAPDVASLGRALREEASAALGEILRARPPSRDLPADDPPHAAGASLAADPLGRAEYDVRLVLEDPAAAAHNAPYARALLEAARRALRSTSAGDPR